MTKDNPFSAQNKVFFSMPALTPKQVTHDERYSAKSAPGILRSGVPRPPFPPGRAIFPTNSAQKPEAAPL